MVKRAAVLVALALVGCGGEENISDREVRHD